MKQPLSFQGYHRTWHVHGRYKCAEPHDEALWFDRRCFVSEDELLAELGSRRVPRIPQVRQLPDGPLLQSFIEGEALDRTCPPGTPVRYWYRRQIMARFRQLAAISPDQVTSSRSCEEQERPGNGDSGGFFRALISFTREEAYRKRLPEYGPLFRRLGVSDHAVAAGSWLDDRARNLARRPFCLLHGDLHRANLIVDRRRRLWTIDWELAMVGDPLYDLATHLYLMDYPARQEERVKKSWRRAVTAELPGADAGMDEDLPVYLAYKRVQSVYTDIVRQAHRRLTPHTATVVRNVLARAADVLGVAEADLPSRREITRAYAEHARSRRALPPAPSPEGAPARPVPA